MDLFSNESDSLENLKQAILLNNCGMLWRLLQDRNNHHFFSSKVSKPENCYFTPELSSVVWANDYLCTSNTNSEGDPYYEFIIDLSISGTINEYNKLGKTFFSEPISLSFTIQAFVFKEGYGISNENIILLNPEQRSLLLFAKNVEKEYEKLDIKLLSENSYHNEEAFTFFTRIWKLVDKSSKAMVENTSLDFFGEFVECHRNIRYSVACANIWGRYTTHYSDHQYEHNNKKIFPLQLNYNDYRYIYYLENAIEELYTFWERVAFLIHQFTKPANLDAISLSFNKLFDPKTRKEITTRYPNLKKIDSNLGWFVSRRSKEHTLLSEYRHPLIHYRSENSFLKGGYNASLSRLWLQNASNDEVQIKKVFDDFSKIQKFINSELQICQMGFEKAILLIEELASV